MCAYEQRKRVRLKSCSHIYFWHFSNFCPQFVSLCLVVGIDHHQSLWVQIPAIQIHKSPKHSKEDGNCLNWYYMKLKSRSMWIWEWLINSYTFYREEEVSVFPSEKFKECCSLCAAYGSQWPGLCLLTPERCREGGCECVRLFEAGGQPNTNKGPALSLSPVIFQLSEKAIVALKKVKLKSLARYVLTAACCMCNTSKYFLSGHSCSFWKGNCPCVYKHFARRCFRMVFCYVSCDVEEAWLTYTVARYECVKEERNTTFLFPPHESNFCQQIEDSFVCVCVHANVLHVDT